MTQANSSYARGAEAFVLCYVSEPWAWFTTDLKHTWGDDWNDAPYEHNAGTPYGWSEHRDCPPYLILSVAFDGPWETPSSYERNSAYSVEQINTGVVPWLRTDRFFKEHLVVIHAGMPLPQFEHAILEGGGNIFLPVVSPLAALVAV